MAKHPGDPPPKNSTAFANNPFAKLARDAVAAATLPSTATAPVVAPVRRPQASPAPRLTLRHESVGRSGKVATRISGVSAEVREIVAARLGKALGCTAEVQDSDVILTGSLKERAAEWIERIGDLRKLAHEKPATVAHLSRPEPSPPPALLATNASGTYRRNVRPGMRVGVVMKEDQPSGELTTGLVRDLLTSSEEHSRGIKVRLVSGQVGRVKVIYK
jgi:uncharacterized repeat protein (TIGR03833 family)